MPAAAPLALARVIGHRGAARHAPENTLRGLRKAAELGATCVEFDVMLSGDGVPLVHHDHDLKRTAGRNDPIGLLPYVEIAKLDAGAWFHEGYAGEPVPRLADAIGVLAELGLSANIELKPAKGRAEETTEVALSVVREHWPASLPDPLISSFDELALVTAREIAPELPRGLLVWELPQDWAERAADLDCVALHVWHGRLTRKATVCIKQAGYTLVTFTLNDPRRARKLRDWGVDSIITDAPEVILEALRR